MAILKRIWAGWLKIAFVVGNTISSIILIVFYFTFFAPFAILFRLFGRDPLAVQSQSSNWLIKEKSPSSMEDFVNEF